MIYNELPTAFLWYDDIRKQHIRQENAETACNYGLIAPNKALLPFEFFKTSLAKPVKWELFTLCDNPSIDLTANLSILDAVGVDGGIYVFYNGSDLKFKAYDNSLVPLNIPNGKYYSVITFEDEDEYFSEVFKVVDNVDDLVKITFYDAGDLAPIKYQGTDFKQIIYLDTFIHSAEPEIEEDGEPDVNNTIKVTFSKLTVKHRLEVYAPDFIKVALTSLQMHSNVTLEAPKQARIGEVKRIEVTSTPEEGLPYNIVSMLLVEEMLVKNSCDFEIEITNNDPWQ